MQLIQTKAKITDGQLILNQPHQNFTTDKEVEVIIILSEKDQLMELEQARSKMQTTFQQAGIETQEQILELIREVKQELFQERYK